MHVKLERDPNEAEARKSKKVGGKSGTNEPGGSSSLYLVSQPWRSQVGAKPPEEAKPPLRWPWSAPTVPISDKRFAIDLSD